MQKIRVLFLCLDNALCSPMAEAFLRHFGGRLFDVSSAGFEPAAALHPDIHTVMGEEGIALQDRQPLSVYALFKKQQHYDYIISVCDAASALQCPAFPGRYTRLSWIHDQPHGSLSHAEVLQLRDNIRADVWEFVDNLNHGITCDTSVVREKKPIITLVQQLLFHRIGVGIVITDPALQIEEINFAFSKMFAVSVESLVGFPLQTLFAHHPLIAQLREFSQSGVQHSDLECLIHNVAYQVKVHKIDLGDEERFIVITFTDVTPDKKAALLEAQMRETIAENEMQKVLLYQRTKQAQTGEMISLIAHQWRQPLNAISALNALMQRQLLDHTAQPEAMLAKLEQMDEIVLHMDATINDFREFFKTDRAKRRVHVDTLIRQAANIARISLEAKGIALMMDLRSDTMLEVFPNELKHVMLNLIKNAEDALMRYVPEEPYIAVRSSIFEERLQISVSDNGGGIDPAVIGSLFAQHVSTRLDTTGTGLGLYMSRVMIVEHLGGEIQASNTPSGARFEIRLPM